MARLSSQLNLKKRKTRICFRHQRAWKSLLNLLELFTKSAQNAPLTRSPRGDDGDNGDDGAGLTAYYEDKNGTSPCQAVGGILQLPASVGPAKELIIDIPKHLRQLEEQLLDPAIRRDRQSISRLLADEFREFGSSGRVFGKEDILAELASESSMPITLDDFQAEAVASDVFLATYRATRTATASVSSLRSSLWVFRDARWQMLFHQGTKCI
ncbi:MAG: nuclear transport factor 2 family protein [Acidobacteriaceae bacterium]